MLTWLKNLFRNGDVPRNTEILPPLYRYRPKAKTLSTQQKRQDAIYKVLSEFQGESLTYTELQEIVRLRTGTACSRKVIARWKKQNLQSA
jgi:hypothetical protein